MIRFRNASSVGGDTSCLARSRISSALATKVEVEVPVCLHVDQVAGSVCVAFDHVEILIRYLTLGRGDPHATIV